MPRNSVRRRPRARPAVAVAALAVLVLPVLGGCTTISDQLAITPVSDSGPDPTAPGALPSLTTTDWGVTGSLVSVVVTNHTDRVVRRARLAATLRDADGTVLGTSTSMPDQSGCCTAEGVGPGESHGFYFLTDVPVADPATARLEVGFREAAWTGPAGAPEPAARALPVGVEPGAGLTVAVVDVATVDALPAAVVQAELRDPAGRLVAVVSATWTCLPAATTTRARLELFEPVPDDVRIGAVWARPAPLGGGAAPDC
ncbi:hypothetical protein [Nocardioides sp. SYSU D00038]|uniref:hypothetical protein n=1 Tax=Nocardioides sp. SYSU D00038 TaxID=2812554 RepID=UPI0019681031|nr:hypothetical protein [Nocardioides sp. SYSU D00038]